MNFVLYGTNPNRQMKVLIDNLAGIIHIYKKSLMMSIHLHFLYSKKNEMVFKKCLLLEFVKITRFG